MTACATKTTAGYLGVVQVATAVNSDPVDIILDLRESINSSNDI
jgi:hypothetical protein